LGTEDECHLPGTVNSYCTNDPIACFDDLDCGVDGYVGGTYCVGKDVKRLFESFSCNNAGTADSYCSSDVDEQLIDECVDVCIGGACADIECHSDSDCDDGDVWTDDVCHSPGTISNYCTNDPIICLMILIVGLMV